MKSTLLTVSLLLSVAFLTTSCTPETSSAPAPTAPTASIAPQEQYKVYKSTNLGIEFQYPAGIPNTFQEKENTITHPDFSGSYLAVYTKPASQSMEDAIKGVIERQGKNPAQCAVETRDTEESGTVEYQIVLAHPSDKYSAAEQKEITAADAEAKADGGPFNGEWKKREIQNKRLVEACSPLAEPLGLGTSKSTPSMFLYNPSESKITFVFVPGSVNPEFYVYGTIRFLVN